VGVSCLSIQRNTTYYNNEGAMASLSYVRTSYVIGCSKCSKPYLAFVIS
jgi:hypothetical protein